MVCRSNSDRKIFLDHDMATVVTELTWKKYLSLAYLFWQTNPGILKRKPSYVCRFSVIETCAASAIKFVDNVGLHSFRKTNFRSEIIFKPVACLTYES